MFFFASYRDYFVCPFFPPCGIHNTVINVSMYNACVVPKSYSLVFAYDLLEKYYTNIKINANIANYNIVYDIDFKSEKLINIIIDYNGNRFLKFFLFY